MKLKPYPQYKESGLNWFGPVPFHWEQLPGLDILSEKQERNLGLKEMTILSLSYGRIIIKSKDKLHGLVPESFETYQIVEPGDIIIRSTDLQNDKVSLRVGEVKNSGIITSAYLCLKPKKGLTKSYAYILLHGFDLMKVFYGWGSGLRQNLSWSDFRRLPFFIPSIAEQQQISRYLDWKTTLIAKFIKAKKRQIELLKEQKQVIINDVVTGKIDVRTGKPYLKYKDSGVEWLGMVPEEWEVIRLRNCILDFQPGIWGEDPNDSNIGIWCIRVADFEMKNLSINCNKKTFRRISTKDFQKKALKKGDILIEKSGGGDNQPVGRAVLFDVDEDAICSNFVSRLRIKSSIVFPDYILKILFLLQATKRNLPSIKQTTGIQNLDERLYYSNWVCIPSVGSQAGILDYINDRSKIINELILKSENEVALLQEYRSKLIADSVTGKLDVRNIIVPETIHEDVTAEVIELEESEENLEDPIIDNDL